MIHRSFTVLNKDDWRSQCANLIHIGTEEGVIKTQNKDGMTITRRPKKLKGGDKGRKSTATTVEKRGQLDNFIHAWKLLMGDYEPGFSPLTLAVKEGYVDAVKELVAAGADVNQRDGADFTPLERAIADDNVEMIHALAEVEADLNVSTVVEHVPPVCKAARMGCIPALRALVEAGGNVNSVEKDGSRSSVYTAAWEGRVDVIRVLRELGADLNLPDEDGRTPASVAAEQGGVEVIRALGELGADCSVSSNQGNITPLYVAAFMGHVGAITELTNHGANVNTCSVEGRSPVFIAAEKGQVGAVRTLAELGADIHTPDECGRTPVFVAAEEGRVEVIRALAELGADVNTPGEGNYTPVYAAAEMDHADAIRALAELGADVNTPNDDGNTPLFGAARRGFMGAITALVESRADINKRPDMLSSPLQIVLETNSDSCLQVSLLLVDNGADVMHLPFSSATREIWTMMAQLFDSVSWNSEYTVCDRHEESETKCVLFSMSKLLASSSRDNGDAHDDGAVAEQNVFETAIAKSWLFHIPSGLVSVLLTTPYVLKRRLVRIAWRVYQSTLLLDGDRITLSVKAQRYVELVRFLFDLTALEDVSALRLTCKSNNERRRFPIYFVSYRELEANIIEEWLANPSCRFVSTDVMCAVIRIHQTYS